MAKRDEEDDEDVQSSNSSSKHKVIVILAMTGILLLFILMLMLRKTASVGQAVYVEPTAVVAAPAGLVEVNKVVIWPGFSQVTAAKNDIVTIPLYLMSASGQEVTAVDMNVVFDKAMLSIDPTQLTVATYPTGEWIGKPIEIAVDISAGKQVSLMSNGGMKSGGVFAMISFRVVGGYVDTDILSSVTFDVVKVTGVENGVKYVAVVEKPKVMANVVIVPKCDDSDLDNYGKPTTDQRACGKRAVDSTVAKTGVGAFSDCDDVNGAIHPGVTEVCNGWDDNCNDDLEKVWDNDAKTGVDVGLVGVWNDNLQGVCYGKKLCEPVVVGKEGWVNSYEAIDQLKNKIAFNDGAKSYTQSELYQKAIPGVDVPEVKCDFFDNDCDGVVNDFLVNCKIGGGGVPAGLLPTGNAFFEYDKNNQLIIQKITQNDVGILPSFKQVRDLVKGDKLLFDGAGKQLQGSGDKDDWPFQTYLLGNLVWLCDDGKYYVQPNNDKNVYMIDYKTKSVLDMIKTVVSVDKRLLIDGIQVLC